jgi:hypothetical protein
MAGVRLKEVTQVSSPPRRVNIRPELRDGLPLAKTRQIG